MIPNIWSTEPDIDIERMSTAKKTKIRGGHKAHVQKLLAGATDIIREFDMKKEVELLGYRDTLKRKAEVLAQLDDQILLETDDEEIPDMIELNEKVQFQIQEKITEIDVILKRAYKAEEEKKVPITPEPTNLKNLKYLKIKNKIFS